MRQHVAEDPLAPPDFEVLLDLPLCFRDVRLDLPRFPVSPVRDGLLTKGGSLSLMSRIFLSSAAKWRSASKKVAVRRCFPALSTNSHSARAIHMVSCGCFSSGARATAPSWTSQNHRLRLNWSVPCTSSNSLRFLKSCHGVLRSRACRCPLAWSSFLRLMIARNPQSICDGLMSLDSSSSRKHFGTSGHDVVYGPWWKNLRTTTSGPDLSALSCNGLFIAASS